MNASCSVPRTACTDGLAVGIVRQNHPEPWRRVDESPSKVVPYESEGDPSAGDVGSDEFVDLGLECRLTARG